MGDLIQFRIDPLEKQLLDRVSSREGIKTPDLCRRALRREIEAPPRGKLNLTLDPNTASDLLNAAARMGRRSEELVEALIRNHLADLTEEQVDPNLARQRAAQRARELLAGG